MGTAWTEERGREFVRAAAALRELTHRLVSTDQTTEEARLLADALEGMLGTFPPARRASRFEGVSGHIPLDDPGPPRVADPMTGALNPVAAPFAIQSLADPVIIAGRYGLAHEGTPNRVHGAFVAGACDWAMGVAAALRTGRPALTATLTVSYRGAAPLGALVRVEARAAHVDRRKVRTNALVTANDEPIAEAEGLFITLLDRTQSEDRVH